jgi:hypothetical protein
MAVGTSSGESLSLPLRPLRVLLFVLIPDTLRFFYRSDLSGEVANGRNQIGLTRLKVSNDFLQFLNGLAILLFFIVQTLKNCKLLSKVRFKSILSCFETLP